ncbi:thiosulfate sulfurtransferase/rhodanese-like domain-containing protein 3 [Eurytemora carolleeae]|uniref:thiosulfate sulfurtransferase/rhodanese-like domain-containing protein 3 n=1 Tax=Eurytemora carolleeae TaxID=1294199 RepID=UPI000C779971|nr:thiosulfate sulfurtransferase/rhodanese-like domain-containing protein 3 [Eurytemora carolleeae]|eukprot:XP_023330770.1 thiosulfate sulfurtransferase/rhodanese-like domain-containing protein 3 [Eurytemora affinis]
MGSQSSTVDFEGVLAASEKGSPLIIDVRGHDEFAAGYIPSSFCLPLPELGEALALSPEDFKAKYNFDLPAKDQEIISTCRVIYT